MPQDFAPDSYWDVLKERLASIAKAPINAGKAAMATAQSMAPTDPALRPGVPQEAQAGDIDMNSPEFQRRQAVAAALAKAQEPRPQQSQY